MAREVARIVKKRESKNKIIIDSFDAEIVTSVKNQCDCEVGFDTPYKSTVSEQEMRDIRSLGIDWIYVEHSVINPELINTAHKLGLKIMAYTVNSNEIFSQWKKNKMLPDGVITDHMEMMN